jgi:hypothetical protein
MPPRVEGTVGNRQFFVATESVALIVENELLLVFFSFGVRGTYGWRLQIEPTLA